MRLPDAAATEGRASGGGALTSCDNYPRVRSKKKRVASHVWGRRFRLPSLILLAVAPAFCQTQKAADLGRAVIGAGLDPSECYRVREVEFSVDDTQFYLTEGYLIFGKPVNGVPVSAVFSAEVEGGDAEVLLLPPSRSERKSLAGYTGSPNLDEHFSSAVFLFTGAQGAALLDAVRSKETAKKAADIGALLADQGSQMVNNIASSFESRMVLDLLNHDKESQGFFEAVISGRKLGNFDLSYDPRSFEQFAAGQLAARNGKSYWNTWTSFPDRMHRDQPAPSPEVRILSYRIDATLDPSLVLQCVTRIRIAATAASRTVIPLELSGQMIATSAKVDGIPAEIYERDSVRNGLIQNTGNELLLVIPQQPLDPGTEHEIEIVHGGKVVLDTGHQVYYVSARGTWYPSRGLQFATYDVTYHYPKNLDLVSAGLVKEDRTDGDTHTTRHVQDGPVRVLGFNLGQYEQKMVDAGGVQVNVSANKEVEDALRPRPVQFAPVSPEPLAGARPQRPGSGRGMAPLVSDAPPMQAADPSGELSNIAGDVAAAIGFYRARFGDPPVKQVEVSPLPGRFGQGFAGMIYLSTLSYLPATRRPLDSSASYLQVFYGELLRAHEVAHQWWGNVVASPSYHHEWLMEALSNYSALMFLESRKGPKFVDGVLDEYRRQLLTKGENGETSESEGPVVQGRRLENSNNPDAWNAIVYGKGTWIIHMLRRRMGDDRFLKMLAELRRRYEWKTVDTEQFRALCAEFLPAGTPDPKLENFFDEWVYGTGIPTLKLTYSVKGKPGAYKLTGMVAQSDVTDDFSVTVPVEIQTGRGRVVQQVRTGSEPASFTVAVTGPAARAVLDPGASVLRR